MAVKIGLKAGVSAQVIYPGDDVEVWLEFRVDKTLTEPSTLTVAVEDPAGNELLYTYPTAEITKDSTGVYYVTIDVDEAGRWWVRAKGTGAAKKVFIGYFDVKRDRFTTV